MLESMYYAITWSCRQACAHCYDERFRCYPETDLDSMLTDQEKAFPRILQNLPDDLSYIDLEDQQEDGTFPRKKGRIILSGGEVLMDPVRERLLYPMLDALKSRYRDHVRIVIQTCGDLLTAKIIEELLQHGVWMISVSSIDSFHIRDGNRETVKKRLSRMFEEAGMKTSSLASTNRKWTDEKGPVFSFFGATEDSWIGKLWPAGRAWKNGLSTARYQDNFCHNWSGGLNFLNLGHSGSEVSIDPEGNVFPCCRKTAIPYGNLGEESLEAILNRLQGQPEFEAIACGHPERMGLIYGVDLADFIALSRTTDPMGRPYVNRCIGCDRIHERFLGATLKSLRNRSRG